MTIEIDRISLSYPDGLQRRVKVLRSVSFEVKPGEIVAIAGANGSGKSTLLRIIAGLLQQSEGTIRIHSDNAHRGSVSLVPQRYRESLFPWRTVWSNIHLMFEGVAGKQMSPAEVQRCILEALKTLEIVGLRSRRPITLSGGQAQLVAIGRAIAPCWPNTLLFDEPFSALDGANLRRAAEALIRVTQTRQTATLVITHDIDVGLLVAKRIVVLGHGTSSVKDIVESPSTGQLDFTLLANPGFVDCKTRVLKALVQ
ncbi:MAG: ATP-binding cassette domain-containing protein [Methylococcaceae bacterium]|nr:ATP-binding cassette domain-containing protein [Methylococcaceae bacterium]MCI0734541.1 ATP-binding cassette domain-containing protein [Methylococcaceae bacterium]